VSVTKDGAGGVDAAGTDVRGTDSDRVAVRDEADAGMGDSERDRERQDTDAGDWDESSSSASVDVSSGYDDSSSSDCADEADKSKYDSAAGWKEPARRRNSDRLLDLIQVPNLLSPHILTRLVGHVARRLVHIDHACRPWGRHPQRRRG
jgi:hypothetical protein